MKRLAIALLFTFAASASEPTTIAFHVQLTDARTALRANPQFEQLNLTEEQVERAAKDRVLMLDKTAGTKWTWLMLSWPEGKSVEHGLNIRGGATVGTNADMSLKPVDEKSVQVRCLREACVLNESIKMKKDQTHTVAFDSDIKVVFP